MNLNQQIKRKKVGQSRSEFKLQFADFRRASLADTR